MWALVDFPVYSIYLAQPMGGRPIGICRRTGRVSLLVPAVLMLLLGAVAGCGGGTSASTAGESDSGRTTVFAGAKKEPAVPLPSAPPKGLVVKDLRPGWGVEAQKGDHLTTKLVAEFTDGRPFESSWTAGAIPFS